MKKYIIGAVIGLVCGLAGTTFASWPNADVQVYTDPDTEVQYLIATQKFNESVSVSIVPRYTPSGNIMYVGSEIVE